MEDIAKRAQLSKGAFYLHFKSKEQIFHEIVDHFLADLQRATNEYHVDCMQAMTAPEVLDTFCVHDEATLEFLWKNRDIMRIVFYGGRTQHPYSHALDMFLDAQAHSIAAKVRQLQVSGVYADDFDAETCAWVVAGGWFNLSRRMSQMTKKPDFSLWALTLRRLFGQGLMRR